MEQRTLQVGITVTGFALAVLMLHPSPVWQDLDAGLDQLPLEDTILGRFLKQDAESDPEPDAEQETYLHDHAYLFFFTDGGRKDLNFSYIERDRNAHFHQDDGIIHIEGERSNISRVMDTMNVTVNASCIRFGLDDETHCAGEDTAIRFHINGEDVPVEEALGHEIEQNDNIVIYHGDRDAKIPEEYRDRVLPEALRPSTAYDNL